MMNTYNTDALMNYLLMCDMAFSFVKYSCLELFYHRFDDFIKYRCNKGLFTKSSAGFFPHKIQIMSMLRDHSSIYQHNFIQENTDKDYLSININMLYKTSR